MNKSMFQKFFEYEWLVEILYILLSCSLTITICVILHKYNENPPPNLGSLVDWGITLNTIVSMLVTIAVFASAGTASACLDQLKLLWFIPSPRPLCDFETFDRAGQCLFASMHLLWKLRLKLLPSWGALLLITQLLIPPLTQQSVQFEDRRVPTSEPTATVPHVTTWSFNTTQTDTMQSDVDFNSASIRLMGSMFAGLFANSSQLINHTLASCSSGNCTFPDYESLSVCSSVANVTNHLKWESLDNQEGKEKQRGKYCVTPDHCLYEGDEPKAANITSASPDVELSRVFNGTETVQNGRDFTSLAFKNHTSPIADFFIIYRIDSRQYWAIEFVLDWCVPTFSTNVTDGTSVTTLRMRPLINIHKSVNRSILRHVEGSPYAVDWATHYTLQRSMAIGLSGAITSDDSNKRGLDNSAHVLAMGNVMGIVGQDSPSQSSHVDWSPDAAFHGLQDMLTNMATSMTNHMRTASQVSLHQGTVEVMHTVAVVQWAWLAAPIAYCSLSALFLLTVGLYSSHQIKKYNIPLDLRKYHSMAILQILDPQLRPTLGSNESEVLVRLVLRPNGLALVEPAKGDMGASPEDQEMVPATTTNASTN